MSRLRTIRFGAVWLVALAELFASPAFAQEAGDKAAAEALYQLAERAMAAGKYAEACPRFEASAKLDPGVGTLLFLGDCKEKLGQPARAWAPFREAKALASSRGDSERTTLAELRATALQPRLSHVTYNVDAHNDMPGFELRRNGLLISSGSWGVVLPSDAGRFELTARAPGYESWSSTVVVPAETSESISVVVPGLHRTAASSSNDFERRPDAPASSAQRVDHAESHQKTWAAVTLGLGAALAATGGVLTVMAIRKDAESKNNCSHDDPNLCHPNGVTQRQDAQHLASLATIFGIGGGAEMTTGFVLWLTAPASSQTALTGLGFGAYGRF